MPNPINYGPEFLVNTNTTNGQFEPSVLGLEDGRFVAAWSSMSGDGSASSIRAQVFDCDGTPVGAEFLVNTTTSNYQYQPAIAIAPKGGFVITWADGSVSGGDTSGFAIRAQMFDANGATNGSEFLVNTTSTNGQSRPAITALSPANAASPGLFVVVWTDDSASGGDTSGSAIRAQLFNANGSTFGTEFLVNTATAGSQSGPTVTALAGGRFVVSWEDAQGDGSGYGIKTQMFNANGTPSGGELLINNPIMPNDQYQPTITALASSLSLPTGGFVVTWTDSSSSVDDPFAHAVRARIYNDTTASFGLEFLVNTTTASGQNQPSVTAFADGRFVMVWTDQSQTGGDTSFAAIRAQLFKADGSTSGTEFLVNTTTANGQIDPTVTALADGRFVVAWEDNSGVGGDTSGTGIRAQIFDPRAAAVLLTGTFLDDCLVGTQFNDTISGSFGNDHLSGGAGKDTMFGEDGNDRLFGGAGTDQMKGGTGDDSMYGGASLDYMYGEAGNDHMYGGASGDWLYGGADADRLFAQGGNDQLRGGDGIDTLYGGIGHDYVNGGAGADFLYGGNGNDGFEYFATSEGGDLIFDFHGTSGDDDGFRIMATGFGGGLVAGALNPSQFQSRIDNVAQDSNDRFIFNTSSQTLWFDIDGNGAASPLLIATLQPLAVVTAADILIF